MEKIIIRGGNPLSGSVRIHGAKNAVLPILAATVMTEGIYTISNCPHLSDVETTAEILEHLGATVERDKDVLTVDTHGSCSCSIPERLMQRLRSSVIFTGAILARCGYAKVSAPGGCELGPRPVDLHLKAFLKLGAKVKEAHGFLEITAKRLIGCNIYLDFPSVGATENILLAATAAEGETVIHNAAKEPEIEDLAAFLNRMGAEIYGAGSSTIRVIGQKPLKAATHTVMPDRIEAATFLCAAAATGGNICVQHVCPEHLSAVLSVLEDCGCMLTCDSETVTLFAPKRLIAPGSIRTMPYPGFPTDAQSPVLAMLCKANGTTMITETIFENRFKPVSELSRMGANIRVSDRVAVVCGTEKLYGATVCAEDLRGGAALIIAGLSAEGKTEIANPFYIDRGYETIENKLAALGADIKRCR